MLVARIEAVRENDVYRRAKKHERDNNLHRDTNIGGVGFAFLFLPEGFSLRSIGPVRYPRWECRLQEA